MNDLTYNLAVMPSAASGDRKSMRWVTFDCFGTLVDWNPGFAAILKPLVGDRTPARANWETFNDRWRSAERGS